MQNEPKTIHYTQSTRRRYCSARVQMIALFKAIHTLFSDIREMDAEDDLLADTEMRMSKDLDGNALIAIKYDGAGYEYLNYASGQSSRARLEKLAIDHGFTLEDQNKWSCVLYLE